MYYRFFAPLVVMAATVSSHAAMNWHGSLVTWNAATGGAAMTEDFSSFAADTQFRTQSVAINGGTLMQVGTDHAFRNFIDVPPTSLTDNNGTTHASMFVDADPTSDPTTVVLTFDTPQSDFGFETWGAAGSEGAIVSVYVGNTFLGAEVLPTGNAQFTGFEIISGPWADRVVFSSLSGNGNPASGEGFGMDNLVYARAIPEPATLGIMALGAATAWRRRKRG